MNFAIEVPGEASPLSLQELCRVLQVATSSHDQSQRQSASQQLTAWQSHVDYYASLQLAFLEKTLPREIRLLAIIQLKNGIDRHWRHHTLKDAIQPAQKEAIRSNLFRGTVGEEDTQLALHNALVLAKVVRIDYPQAWPDAMTNLVELLRKTKDGNQSDLSGALLIVLRVVKEMGTARLRKSQSALQSITPELVFLLGQIYTSSTSAWTAFLTSGVGEEDAADIAMQNSLTAFKTLRRLLVVGFESPHKDTAVQQAWSLSQTQFGQFLGFASHDSPIPAPYLDTVGKHLIQFTKLHVDMATTHPTSFAGLPSSFDLVRSYWELVSKFAEVYEKSSGLRQESSDMAHTDSKSKTEGPLLEKLALKGLLLLRACIRMVNQPKQTIRYRSAESREDDTRLLNEIKQDLLKDDLIIQIANIIISNLLVFRKADLEAWELEPEEWEQQEETEGSAWEYEVRPCAENVLHLLLVSYKHLLLQPLLSYFETAKNPQADVMTKESVYTALGLAAAHIEGKFDFDGFLKSTIAGDAQRDGPLCKVLRRRIGILLSQWVPVRVSQDSRPLIYEIYRHFLNPDDHNNDVVVRITAARQFKIVAQDFEFDGKTFQPYAEGVLRELIRLLEQTDIDETKLAILNTIKAIIERMETYINPFADLIVSALPAVWEAATEMGYMLKQATLTILQSLVMSMREESRRYHADILPLITQAVDQQSDVYLYLIEEALELWMNLLLQSEPPLSAEMLSLAEPAVQQLIAHDELHQQHLSIMSSYILLAPENMLSDRFRQPLLKGLAETYSLDHMRTQLAVATKQTEVVIRLAQDLGKLDGLKIIVRDMMEVGFLPQIFEAIHDAYVAHQTSGPNRQQPKVSNFTLTDYFSILARIAVADAATFVEMLASIGPLDQVWGWLSTEWFSSFDTMADELRQKLNLLALTSLLELGQPMQELLLSKLQDYFSMWTSVMSLCMNGTEDLLIVTELGATQWDTPKDLRERSLITSDPIRRINSLEFVKERLASLVERTGGEMAFQNNYAANVDADVLAGFQRLGVPRDSDS